MAFGYRPGAKELNEASVLMETYGNLQITL